MNLIKYLNFSLGTVSADQKIGNSVELYHQFIEESTSPYKGWKEGFVAFAEYVAKSADNCGTLQGYVHHIN